MANQTVQWYGGELIGFSRARHLGSAYPTSILCGARPYKPDTQQLCKGTLAHVPLDLWQSDRWLDYFVAIPFRHNLDAFRRIITPPLGIPPNARSTLQNCWNSDSVNLMAFESAFRTFSDELMY